MKIRNLRLELLICSLFGGTVSSFVSFESCFCLQCASPVSTWWHILTFKIYSQESRNSSDCQTILLLLSTVPHTSLKCRSMLPTPPIWPRVLRDQSRGSNAFTHELMHPLNKSVPGIYHTPNNKKTRQHLCSGLISVVIAYVLSLVLYVLSERRVGSPIQATWTTKAKVIACRKVS